MRSTTHDIGAPGGATDCIVYRISPGVRSPVSSVSVTGMVTKGAAEIPSQPKPLGSFKTPLAWALGGAGRADPVPDGPPDRWVV